MKLLNQSLKYLSIALVPVIGVWALFLYLNLLDEVRDSIDDGLDNHRLSILQSLPDSALPIQPVFEINNYTLSEIPAQQAMSIRDTYLDTAVFMMNEQDFEPVRMLRSAFERNGRYYELKVISSMVEEDDLVEDLFWSLVWLYLILLLTLVLINSLLLRKIWKPFYLILENLKEYRLGSREKFPVVETNIAEFSELKRVANNLISNASQTFENQKAFTENASHELQTPLAIALNKLEHLIENADLGKVPTEGLAEVIAVLERIKRLNKSLLLLTRIENKQFVENEEVSIGQLLRDILEESDDYIRFRNLVADSLFTEEKTLNMNTDLARILFSNLIKNALVHNTEGGAVSLELSASSLRISNTGSKEALHPDKIFTRFYKSEAKKESTGLGLSIVKAISDLYGFRVEYQYQSPSLHVVELFFHP